MSVPSAAASCGAAVALELPAGRAPISLLIDDSVPGINPLFYFRTQVLHETGEGLARTIPNSFLRDFGAWVRSCPVRGKMTVLPFPAGLGSLTTGWEGYSRREVDDWLAVMRDELLPRFDVHPEVLTHTMALDLESLTLRRDSEHEWMGEQTEDTLCRYIARSIKLLQDAGLQPGGFTQPCFFRGDELVYAHAIQRAFAQQQEPGLRYYFLHVEAKAPHVEPRLILYNRRARQGMVALVGATGDFFWNGQDAEAARSGKPVGQPASVLADGLIAEDGSQGRLVDLLATRSSLVLVTHWQSLYSDGSARGLDALAEVVRRVERHMGDSVVWLRADDLARYYAARATAQCWLRPAAGGWTLQVDVPFACRGLTLSLSLPTAPGSPLNLSMRSAEGEEERSVPAHPGGLVPGQEGWAWQGERLWLSLDVEPGEQQVRIQGTAAS